MTSRGSVPHAGQSRLQPPQTRPPNVMLIHADDLGYGDRSERLPMAHGFDEYFGIPYSNDMNPRVLMHNKEIVGQEATLEWNGPWFMGSTGRLRGRKGSTCEAGVRVPFIAR